MADDHRDAGDAAPPERSVPDDERSRRDDDTPCQTGSGASARFGRRKASSDESSKSSRDFEITGERSSPERLRSDGGTATGADETTLDPWGSSTVADYRNLFEEFGIEEFDDVLPTVPDPHYLMRRGVIFGHRDYDRVLAALDAGEPAAALSGFMPTGDPHIGHKLVFDELVWHQERGADSYGLIADLEAHSARGLDWDEIDEHAQDYLLSLIALGFDPEEGELYRQSDNRQLQDLAFELGVETNLSELESIYGFGGETDVSHMQSVVTQMADILYPQLDEPKPTVIPVGPDQDPHVRLARDLAARMRFFGVTAAYASFEAEPEERHLLAAAYEALSSGAVDEDADPVRCVAAADWLTDQAEADDADSADPTRGSVIEKLRAAGKEPLRPRTRFLDRNATDDAFAALIEAIDGEKRVYDEHVDSFDLALEAADDLAREIELDHGGYGFVAPSSV